MLWKKNIIGKQKEEKRRGNIRKRRGKKKGYGVMERNRISKRTSGGLIFMRQETRDGKTALSACYDKNNLE